MNEDSLRKKTFVNLFWRFLERCGAQFVSFIVSIVLARLLLPEDYGIVALVTVIISILNVFVDSGLGNALVQRKNAGDLEFSTVFYTNVFVCVILYMILFFISPYIAVFYKNENLTSVIRILGFTLIISGLKNIQQAYVSKKMLFKKFFFATLLGTVVSAVVGILLAYKGCGVWALVVQQLVNLFIDTVVLWIIVPWKPSFKFSFMVLKDLFSYGWKILIASLIHTVYIDIRQLVIGRVYTPLDLAFYNQGQKFPQLISTNINNSIDSVLFPVLSDVQDTKTVVKAMTRRAIKIAAYIMWPLLLGLAAVSGDLVKIVLSEKWIGCVPYFVIACFCFGFQPLQSANLNAIKALGKSDVFLKLEIIKKTIAMGIVIITIPFGVRAIAIGGLIYELIASICNSFPNKKMLDYSYVEQIKDMFPAFFVSLLMSGFVYFLPFSFLHPVVQLILKILIGIVFYVGVTALFHFDSYTYLKKIVLHFFKR